MFLNTEMIQSYNPSKELFQTSITILIETNSEVIYRLMAFRKIREFYDCLNKLLLQIRKQFQLLLK